MEVAQECSCGAIAVENALCRIEPSSRGVFADRHGQPRWSHADHDTDGECARLHFTGEYRHGIVASQRKGNRDPDHASAGRIQLVSGFLSFWIAVRSERELQSTECGSARERRQHIDPEARVGNRRRRIEADRERRQRRNYSDGDACAQPDFQIAGCSQPAFFITAIESGKRYGFEGSGKTGGKKVKPQELKTPLTIGPFRGPEGPVVHVALDSSDFSAPMMPCPSHDE